jgi:hypothetical protein
MCESAFKFAKNNLRLELGKPSLSIAQLEVAFGCKYIII